MTSPPSEPPYGAAPERTALAWQRSGLGVVVGCFLTVHSSVRLGVIPIAVAAVGLGLVITVLALAFPSRRFLRGDPADSWRLLAALTTAVVALALLGAIVAFINLR
ncbi:DUF202 domain-containing protein [Nakamurella sp. GG22]